MELQTALILAFSGSFLVTLLAIPRLIKKMRMINMMGPDRNKPGRPLIPEMGGIACVIGFIAGIGILLSLKIAKLDVLLMASLLAIIGSAFTGMLDDVINIRQRAKAVLPFLFAIPLGTVNKDTSLWFPIIGSVELGMVMMVIIPLGVTCASNTMNMLEGFNGLGAGLGLIISSTLIILSLIHNRYESLYLLVPLLGTLIPFLWFNKYPAKLFPGDTLTLFMGATIGCAAIIGDMKTHGALLFIPMIIEFFLKLKGKFRGENFGKPDNHGYLRYTGRIESLTHIVMKKVRVKEWQLVALFWIVEILVCTIVVFLVIFR